MECDIEWTPAQSIGKVPQRKRTRRTIAAVNYTTEKTDSFFDDRPGYTHFERTRKGKDHRPRGLNATKKTLPAAAVKKKATLHNFFTVNGKAPLPLTPNKTVDLTKDSQQAKTPQEKKPTKKKKKVQLKWGRPTSAKQSETDELAKLRKDIITTKTAGCLSVPAQKRRQWHGMMKRHVARLTNCLFEEGGGKIDTTAQIFSNFVSQLAVKPFVESNNITPQHRFANNVLATLTQAKQVCRKPGSRADLFRRHVIVGGASGPVSTEDEVSPVDTL